MQKKKEVLTTGQVAQICNVAPRTVTKWFDSGQLKGYRIPGSRDRRIPTSELIKFMKAHDIPTDALEAGILRLLIIDSNNPSAQGLSEKLNQKDYETYIASNSFDAGLAAQKIVPHVILVNLMSQEVDATQLCRYVRNNDELSSTKVIAIANNLGEKEAKALQNKGFDGAVTDTDDINNLIRTIQEVTAIVY